MTHVVDALGSDKGPDLDRIALAMVDVATKIGSDEAVSEDNKGTPMTTWLLAAPSVGLKWTARCVAINTRFFR